MTESIHGREVSDPWRRLENLDHGDTKAFIQQQNEVSHAIRRSVVLLTPADWGQLSVPWLSGHPARSSLTAAVRASLETKTTTVPKLQGDGYYYWRWNESLPRDLVVRSKHLERDFGKAPRHEGGRDAEWEGPEVVLDLNKEEHMSLYMDSWSGSGRYYGVVLQKSG